MSAGNERSARFAMARTLAAAAPGRILHAIVRAAARTFAEPVTERVRRETGPYGAAGIADDAPGCVHRVCGHGPYVDRQCGHEHRRRQKESHRPSCKMERGGNAEVATTLHRDSLRARRSQVHQHRNERPAPDLDGRMPPVRGAPRGIGTRGNRANGPARTTKEATHDQDETSAGGRARRCHRDGGEPAYAYEPAPGVTYSAGPGWYHDVQCWISTDQGRGFVYYGSCAQHNED